MLKRKNNLQSGQAMMVATIFFLVVSLTIIFGLAGPTIRAQKAVRELFFSRQSYFLAEGGVEDVVYRLREGLPVGATETITLGGSSATTVTTDVAERKEVEAVGNVGGAVRKVAADLQIGEGVAFHYGIQIGNGGFTLASNAGVNGNIFSNGSMVGQNGSFVTGSVTAVGNISGVTIGTGVVGDAHAPTVTNSTIRGALYCQSGSGNNKPCNTSQANPTAQPLPISDAQITAWKDEAAAGGSIGTQTLSGTGNILGPKKITGNLTLSNNALLKVTGTLWVTGNVDLGIGAEVELDQSYGSGDGVVVVDGNATLSNNSVFRGSGNENSYIMILSTSNSGSAIVLKNNAGAAILYAASGTVRIYNNAGINQVTAQTVALEENAVIDYEQGLVDAGFVNGPSGGYEIEDWQEVE